MRADLHHYHGVHLDDALDRVPAVTLAQWIRHLPEDSATARAEAGDMAGWTLLASNVADLLDLLTYWVTSEYVGRTTDPDDPEVKAERKRRKAAGLRPPPVPLVQPVAHRPPSLAAQYQQRFEQMVEQFRDYRGPDRPADADQGPGRRMVSSDDFDAALGL